MPFIPKTQRTPSMSAGDVAELFEIPGKVCSRLGVLALLFHGLDKTTETKYEGTGQSFFCEAPRSCHYGN